MRACIGVARVCLLVDTLLFVVTLLKFSDYNQLKEDPSYQKLTSAGVPMMFIWDVRVSRAVMITTCHCIAR